MEIGSSTSCSNSESEVMTELLGEINCNDHKMDPRSAQILSRTELHDCTCVFIRPTRVHHHCWLCMLGMVYKPLDAVKV